MHDVWMMKYVCKYTTYTYITYICTCICISYSSISIILYIEYKIYLGGNPTIFTTETIYSFSKHGFLATCICFKNERSAKFVNFLNCCEVICFQSIV